METKEIVNEFITSWEKNQFDKFTQIFADDAYITHPYFVQPISAKESMEVMNTAVRGSSMLENYELVEGTGDGRNDKVRMEICDMGDRVRDICHIGVLPVFVTVQEGKIVHISVEKGIVKKIKERKRKRKIKKRKDNDSSLEIAVMLANYWGSNYAKEFLSLFWEDAKVHHILYINEISAEEALDVMNSNVLGTTKLYGFQVQKGSGEGRNDTIYLKFIETGDQIGYVPDVQGVMNVQIKILGHRISHLDVLGYGIVDVTGKDLKQSSTVSSAERGENEEFNS